MPPFKGFPEGKAHLTPIPELFFEQLLPHIDHLGELRLTLYVFWRLDRMEGAFRYLRRSDFTQDEPFMRSLAQTSSEAQAALDEALQRAVRRGSLLVAEVEGQGGTESCFFLNSPKGRAALRAIESGQWKPTFVGGIADHAFVSGIGDPAYTTNIFRLYEENIGPLTPLLAEALGEAEDAYPAAWIEEAIHIAVEKNKRNWRYISAILERWLREGRHGQKENLEDRRDSAEARRRYYEGDYSDLIKH